MAVAIASPGHACGPFPNVNTWRDGRSGIESRRLGIRHRISVGGREDHQHDVSGLHRVSGDRRVARDEATRVLNGRIVAHHFTNDRRELAEIRTARAVGPVSTQCHQGVPDQPGGGFVRLRQKTDAVGDDVLALGAARARDFSIQIAEQGERRRATARVQQRSEGLEHLGGRGGPARQPLARRGGRDALREGAHQRGRVSQPARRHPEQAGEYVRR